MLILKRLAALGNSIVNSHAIAGYQQYTSLRLTNDYKDFCILVSFGPIIRRNY